MAFNPNHSWAVTYNQMWNLSMRDPIPKGQRGLVGPISPLMGHGINMEVRLATLEGQEELNLTTAGIGTRGSNANLVIGVNS